MVEGQALNIHMFCARRPGILLSTIRVLESLGFDIEQAVISCFSGFAMDIFGVKVRIFSTGRYMFYATVAIRPCVLILSMMYMLACYHCSSPS
jgi:hypothetical protein